MYNVHVTHNRGIERPRAAIGKVLFYVTAMHLNDLPNSMGNILS